MLLDVIICCLISVWVVRESELHGFDLHSILGMGRFEPLDQVELHSMHHMAMNL